MRDPLSAGPRWHRASGAAIRTGERMEKASWETDGGPRSAGGLQNGVHAEAGTGSELLGK